jgi:hypothetical protein
MPCQNGPWSIKLSNHWFSNQQWETHEI